MWRRNPINLVIVNFVVSYVDFKIPNSTNVVATFTVRPKLDCYVSVYCRVPNSQP